MSGVKVFRTSKIQEVENLGSKPRVSATKASSSARTTVLGVLAAAGHVGVKRMRRNDFPALGVDRAGLELHRL